MAKIISQIDINSKEFINNAEHMREQVDCLKKLSAKIKLGGGKDNLQRHIDRGKLPPRKRIEALLDVNSPFLEFSLLAAHQVYQEEVPASYVLYKARYRPGGKVAYFNFNLANIMIIEY